MAGSRRRKRHHGKNRAFLAALMHPLRRRILQLMEDGREASIGEIGEELGEPRGRVAYHVKLLADSGALQVADEQQSQGVDEPYRSSLEPGWAETMPDEDEE